MSADVKSRQDHAFGGDWTTRKLEVLRKYLGAYTVALKNQRFEKIYVDGFAGTGFHRPAGSPAPRAAGQRLLFDAGAPELRDGSARMALRVDPPFDKYIFIESRKRRSEALREMAAEFDRIGKRVDVRHGDANQRIRGFCSSEFDPQNQRAVLFLDPYGAKVDWSTLQVVASTKAIDVWYLFPLIALNRMLPKRGPGQRAWVSILDRILGTPTWQDEFYKPIRGERKLWDEPTNVGKVPIDVIQAFVISRLESIFPFVAKKPAILRNSTNSPMYMLCFAISNDSPPARGLAERIANGVLRGFS